MDSSLALEQGLGDHLGVPKQEVERGNYVDTKRYSTVGISFTKKLRIRFDMSTYPMQQE